MQPDLENVKKKIKENRDLVDRITSSLPGYNGYVEKSENFDTDKILREFISDRIAVLKREVDSISGDFFKKGENRYLSDLDSLNVNLERLLKKCRYADYGTSKSFSNMKISEEDLNRLLEYDWRMIGSLDEFDKIISGLNSNEEDEFTANYKNMKEKIKEFEKAFDERKYVILEVI